MGEEVTLRVQLILVKKMDQRMSVRMQKIWETLQRKEAEGWVGNCIWIWERVVERREGVKIVTLISGLVNP